MEVINGIPVSPGVVIGRAFVLDDAVRLVPRRTVPVKDVPNQHRRLTDALEAAVADLEHDRDRAAAELGPDPAKIFDFHLSVLRDRTLVDHIAGRIQHDRVTAEYAVSEEFRKLSAKFRAMDSEVFRQKSTDIMDLDRRVLAKLIGESEDRLANLRHHVILIAHDITPTRAASLDRRKVIGVATDVGGRTSHASIVASALGVPVVVGCQIVTARVEDGDSVVIDGKNGRVIVRPDPDTLAQYVIDVQRMDTYQMAVREVAALEPVTLDGTRISLMGNIEFPHEIAEILANHGDGVGLYRTEYMFLVGKKEPGEEEQFQAAKECLELLQGRPLIIRTLDLGADKFIAESGEEPERNPFLGLRSIRYCLQNIPTFKTQLRAIMRASALGPVKIMFPLVSTSMELRQAKMILRDVMEECDEEGIEFNRDVPVGIMVEVPSAALTASTLAREVAFFSIGTNDLVQYTLAVDRGNERVANLYSAAQPAVLQLIREVIRAGRRFGVETSLCGEIAGEVDYTMLLLGMGLRSLSMVPSQIPAVKQVIRSVDMKHCERVARKAGSFDSERQVINFLRAEVKKVLPEMG